MAKRTRTRAQQEKRIIDLVTDEINVADAGGGLSPEERSQAVRRALVLRWARQRRRRNLAHHDH
jgi:hypothetical protein